MFQSKRVCWPLPRGTAGRCPGWRGAPECVRRGGRKAAVFAWLARALRHGGIVLESHELHIVELQLEFVDGLLDEIAVAIADVLEVCGGDADEEDASVEMTDAGRLEEGVEGLPIDLFFQCPEDACPWIDDSRAGWNKRHTLPSTGAVRAQVDDGR